MPMDKIGIRRKLRNYKWQFVATFYIKGRYTVTITAYNSEGESVSDEFIYIY